MQSKPDGLCGCGGHGINRPLIQLAELVAVLEHRHALVNRITREIEAHLPQLGESDWEKAEYAELAALVELLRA